MIRHIDEGRGWRGALGWEWHEQEGRRCRDGNSLGPQSKHVQYLLGRREQLVAHDLRQVSVVWVIHLDQDVGNSDVIIQAHGTLQGGRGGTAESARCSRALVLRR